MSTFKIDITMRPLFSRISYLLVPKIEVCLKYFSDKNSPKQPQCAWYGSVSSVCRFLVAQVVGSINVCCWKREGKKGPTFLYLCSHWSTSRWQAKVIFGLAVDVKIKPRKLLSFNINITILSIQISPTILDFTFETSLVNYCD